jgi:hypothetical protein
MILVEPFEIIVEDCYDYINNEHYEDAYTLDNKDHYKTLNKESQAFATKHNCTNSCKYITKEEI